MDEFEQLMSDVRRWLAVPSAPHVVGAAHALGRAAERYHASAGEQRQALAAKLRAVMYDLTGTGDDFARLLAEKLNALLEEK